MTDNITDQAVDPSIVYSRTLSEMMNELINRQRRPDLMEWKMGADIYLSIRKTYLQDHALTAFWQEMVGSPHPCLHGVPCRQDVIMPPRLVVLVGWSRMYEVARFFP